MHGAPTGAGDRSNGTVTDRTAQALAGEAVHTPAGR